MKTASCHASIRQRLGSLLAVTFIARSFLSAEAQEPRLTIKLDYPSALSSVGSVLVAPNGNMVLNHDGFAGYQDGAIFILDSTGNLLRRISATRIPALPYPVWLAPTARAVLPDGSLIADYVTDRYYQTGLLRLRLNPDGVAVSPGNDDYLPLGPLAVQANGGLVIGSSLGVPLVRFAQETQGERRGFLSLDQNFYNQVQKSAAGRSCAGLATGTDSKLWAWLVDTNSIARLTRFLPDGRLDPEFNQITSPHGFASSWIGPLPDGRAFVCLAQGIVRLMPDGALDSNFRPITSMSGCQGDATVSLSDILAPLPDGGLIVPGGCDFTRFRPDGTPDETWNSTRSSFHGEDYGQVVLQVVIQPDGHFLVVYGQASRRSPRPKLGRLLADGRLDVASFEPPNTFALTRGPVIVAEGMTPGRWYVLERSECLDPRSPTSFAWNLASDSFRAPAADLQPLRFPQPGLPFSVSFWRVREVSTP